MADADREAGASIPASSPAAKDATMTGGESAPVPLADGAVVAAPRPAGINKPTKPKRIKTKKRKPDAGDGDVETAINLKRKKAKKIKKADKDKDGPPSKLAADADGKAGKKPRKKIPKPPPPGPVGPPVQEGLSAAQIAVNEQMRRVLEEDQYSANGSIVDTDSDEEDSTYRGETVRMERTALMAAMRKHLFLERMTSGPGSSVASSKPGGGDDDDDNDDNRRGGRKKKKKVKRGKDDMIVADDEPVMETSRTADAIVSTVADAAGDVEQDYDDRDGGSIFGQTTGSSNATWVECDKCKKWRRLRGVVDEKKLPTRWFCSMNKNDPERARCSAPEEEYEAPHTPESAADARTRKHLRVWVRRLQCNEAYEAKQPTLTRGRKRANASTSKEPYEWIRCCNQSCGKWRAILRIMDARSSVMERTVDGEWYCVMNTWDEKMASCAAPQENLPAIGCPPWVNQDEILEGKKSN